VGVDFAGTVESVGDGVTLFKQGDPVFGASGGAFAEYVMVREHGSIVRVPPALSLEQAAGLPIAGVTALQGLRDHGQLHAGQKVLINGASGGVGTFAVQIAKALGAEVTGVCSTRNVDLVRSLGADHVIDYTQEDFTQGSQRYDLILDNVGNHPLLAVSRVLNPHGTVVIVSGPKTDPWLGPMGRVMRAAMLGPFVETRFVHFIAQMNPADLGALAELATHRQLQTVIERRYPLAQTAEAVEYIGTGRARGKVVIELQ
jgi:NADPH:quinone reductase-like Zn-dependent oxidoreductase